ncbi:2-oxoglutarate (2OG) and Fe(II)-dependent oxygenase superfamily protein, partial [Striga asiatica]
KIGFRNKEKKTGLMDRRFLFLISLCLLVRFSHGRKDSILRLPTDAASTSLDPTRITQLSWIPRAFLYRKFLTDTECDHLIYLAKDKLEKSMVADNESGKSVESEVRTSSGMFLSKAQDDIIANIEARIAAWTFLPIVKPQKGDALLFFSLHPNATTDPTSLHGSCPVIEGEKWSATKWIHVRSFDKPSDDSSDDSSDNGDCVDKHPNCAMWALRGECKNNPLYMLGSENEVGYCKKSCKACST